MKEIMNKRARTHTHTLTCQTFVFLHGFLVHPVTNELSIFYFKVNYAYRNLYIRYSWFNQLILKIYYITKVIILLFITDWISTMWIFYILRLFFACLTTLAPREVKCHSFGPFDTYNLRYPWKQVCNYTQFKINESSHSYGGFINPQYWHQ